MNLDDVRFDVAPCNGDAKRLVIAQVNGDEIHRSTVNTNSADSRGHFLRHLAKKFQIDPAELVSRFDQRLVHLADQADAAADEDANASESSGSAETEGERKSQATQLIELVMASQALLFHDADGNAYARYLVEVHYEVARISSSTFKRWLAKLFFEKTGKAPNSQAKTDAASVLEGMAAFNGPEHPVYIRLAELNGKIYLDLCNKDWEVVEIDVAGWRVIPESPVMFRRAKAMLPLPTPIPGGSIELLRRYVGSIESSFVLCVAWLIGALRPRGPYPILEFDGEQGSGKTTRARMLRSLVDPNTADLRSEPKDPRDLMIAANNGHVVGLDNLSYMPVWLSDCLCRLATGGGFSTRTLYENDDETIFNSCRPGIINGIEQVPTRGDLLDRTMLVSFPSISEADRRPESQLWQDFNADRPAILGALLTAISAALRNLPTTKLPLLPRMADFALWVTAAEPALGWEKGHFLSIYMGNREEADSLAIDSSPIGKVLIEFLEAAGGWDATATELLRELERQAGLSDGQHKPKGWPGNARALSGAIRRIAPHLRKAGWDVDPDRDRERTRTRVLTIRRVPGNCVQSVLCVQSLDETGEKADVLRTQTAAGEALWTQSGAEISRDWTQMDATDANPRSPSDEPDGEVGEL